MIDHDYHGKVVECYIVDKEGICGYTEGFILASLHALILVIKASCENNNSKTFLRTWILPKQIHQEKLLKKQDFRRG